MSLEHLALQKKKKEFSKKEEASLKHIEASLNELSLAKCRHTEIKNKSVQKEIIFKIFKIGHQGPI